VSRRGAIILNSAFSAAVLSRESQVVGVGAEALPGIGRRRYINDLLDGPSAAPRGQNAAAAWDSLGCTAIEKAEFMRIRLAIRARRSSDADTAGRV